VTASAPTVQAVEPTGPPAAAGWIRVLGWVVWIASAGFAVVGLALVLPHRRLTILNLSQDGASAFIGVTFATIGVFLAHRRPRHPIAWIFLAIGLSQSFSVFALYGTASVATGTRSTWAQVLTWMETWTWAPGFGLIPTLLLQLFPTGRPLSARWRWLVPATLTGLGLAIVGTAFHRQVPGSTANANVPLGYRSPVPTGHLLDPLVDICVVLLLICAVASVASIMLRYRRSSGEEREQLKWFATSAVGTVVFLTGGAFLPVSAPAGVRALIFAGIPLLPIATAVAILKYRLYDIDVVINKAVVYGLLAAFITTVYVAIVVGLGSALGHGVSKPNLPLSILATAVVAVAFQPIRERVQRLANRLVYGKRATPYEVLAGFVQQVGGTYAAEDVLPRMARALTEGTGAAAGSVWLKVGAELRPEASWPSERIRDLASLTMRGEDLPDVPGVSLALPVVHRGALLGALTLTKLPGDPLTSTERSLAENLAGQAGLILRNVGLTEELRARLRDLEASRSRIVSAEEEERRRVERRVEEGARRDLEATDSALDEASAALQSDPERAIRSLGTFGERTTHALESLREVARGIYPPLLADKGLVPALTAQAAKVPIPVDVRGEGIGRLSEDVESTIYFCCLEALQNVVAHARASLATVTLSQTGPDLVVVVSDDGRGFDPASTPWGAGLMHVSDRLEALEGSLEISGGPGGGTTVRVRVPIDRDEHALEPVG